MKRLVYLSMAIVFLFGLRPAVTAGQPPSDTGQEAAGGQSGVEGVAIDYDWSQSLGTYTEITGGTVVTTSCSDESYNNIALPFGFTFNGTAYTAFSIQCNGFIAMGPTVYSAFYPISSGQSNNIVVALGANQQSGASNSEIRYEVLGTEPARVLVVQYRNFRHLGGSQVYNFQIRLYETSNVVQVVYGSFTETGSYPQQVGLRGNSGADFDNRNDGVLNDWTDSQAGTANGAAMTLSTARKPVDGLTWTWTPLAWHPVFDTSTKTATAEVSVGEDITYTVVIKNTGTSDAAAATMVDPIPAGAAYNGDVACDAGACAYNDALDQVEWSGSVPMGGQVTVAFSANTAGLSCWQVMTNTATMSDPNLYDGPVTRSADTRVVGLINHLVLEGFELGVPPPGWTETIVYDPGSPDPDWSRVVADPYTGFLPHGGTSMAKFYSSHPGNLASARLATYALDFSDLSLPRVVFWMSHDRFNRNADRLQIQVSTDGGLTWADAGAPVLRYDPAYTPRGWGLHTVSLAAYAGEPGVLVGFLGISATGSDFYLDDVSIQDACGGPMVMLWPDGAGSACPGTSIGYTLDVKNVSFDPDTIDLDVSGYAWPASVEPASLDLGPNETGQVVVTVQVPWGAAPPESDAATVLATAEGTGETGSATVTTAAGAYGWAAAMQDMAVGGEPSLFWGGSYYYGGEVCVVGGLTGSWPGVVTGAHWCYNIAGQSWAQKASMPIPRSNAAYGLIGSKFYMAGGLDISNTGYTDLQIYDLATDTWSSGAPLPTARGGQAGGVVGGRLYSVGGGSGVFPQDCPTYEYDPIADAWATRASCPLQGGNGFYMGGSVGSDTWGKLFASSGMERRFGWYAFDPAANTWQTLSNLPINKTPLMVENPLTGDIYSIGGFLSPWMDLGQIWKYDYTGDAWTDTGVTLLTAQGGSLGPAHGSFGDPDLQGFWTLGGSASSGSLTPPPFEFWQFLTCPAAAPDIEVVPASLTAEQRPDTVTTQTLQVCNTGVAPLEWSLSEAGAAPGSVRSFASLRTGARPASTYTVQGRAGIEEPPDVLLVNADDDNIYGSPIQALLQGYGDLGAVDLFNAVTGTPDLAYLLNYDVVLTWSISHYADPTALGDVLADYVDAGGRVINLMFSMFPYWAWELAGRFVTENYVPMRALSDQEGTWTCLGMYDAGHPIMAGVTDVCHGYHALMTYLTPASTAVAYWDDDELFVAAKENGTAVTINAYIGYYSGWDGQLDDVVHNAILWLAVQPYDAPWLSADPTSGTVPPGECVEVTVTFDSAGIAPGDYHAALAIDSNDPDEPQVRVPVGMTVVGDPDIEVTPESLAAEQCADTQIEQALQVCNTGSPDLAWSLAEDPPMEWLGANPTGGTLAPGECADVTVTFDSTGMAPGTFTGALDINSNDPDTPQVTVPVQMTVPASPGDAGFAWTPPAPIAGETVTFDGRAGGSEPLTYEWNLGDGDAGTGPVVTHTYAAPGDYDVTLTVSNACGSATVTQTVTLLAPPDVDVTPSSLLSTQGPDTQAQQTLLVCNSGGADLTWNLAEQPAPKAAGIESLSGSYVAFDPSAGGAACYVPGQAQTFCFRAESYTDDYEYRYGVWQRFPAGWTVTDAYVAGTPVCDSGAQWNYFNWSFETEPYEVMIDHRAYSEPTDHCVATYCFDVVTGGGGGGAPASWYWGGDGYGNAPHHPCSADQYTPASMAGEPCDEWVNPQAEVPLCDIPWLSEAPTSGTVAPGACADVTVTFDSTGMGPTAYWGNLLIDSNDPDEPQVVVPVHMEVLEPAAIEDVSYAADGLEVTFDATAVGSNLHYYWDFGDGTISEEEDPVHVFPGGGCWLVRLDVTGDYGSDWWSERICLCVPVSGADFSWMPQEPLPGEEVTFTAWAQGSEPIEYTWDFSDGGGGGMGAVVTHAYAQAGTYLVTMTATNDCGQQVVQREITVGVGDITVGGPPLHAELCPESTTALQIEICNVGDGPLTWSLEEGLLLSLPDGRRSPDRAQGPQNLDWLSAEPAGGVLEPQACADVTVAFASDGLAPGGYGGTLYVNSSDPDTPQIALPVSLTVPEPAHDADFTHTPDLPIPAHPVHFMATAQGTEPLAYDWDLGDGTTGSGPDFYHAYTYMGTYLVTLTAGNACGQQVVTHEVLVQLPQFQYMHLWRVKMNSRAAMPAFYKVAVLGAIHDQNHAGLGEVTVTGHWTYPDGSTEVATALTDSYGRWKVRVRKAMCGLYQFDIDGLSKAGYVDDPARDHSSRHVEKDVPCD